jgi:hypothetical protein
MTPRRVETSVETSRKVNLGASFKLLETIGIKEGIEAQEKITAKASFIRALNELGSNPIWEFNDTASSKIEGGYRFAMVVRSPKNTSTLMSVSLTANVRRKHFRILPYKAEFEGVSQMSITLTRI